MVQALRKLVGPLRRKAHQALAFGPMLVPAPPAKEIIARWDETAVAAGLGARRVGVQTEDVERLDLDLIVPAHLAGFCVAAACIEHA